MSLDIHDQQEYKRHVADLDDLIGRFTAYVNRFAHENEPVPDSEVQSIMVSGWVLGIATAGFSQESGEFDKLLYQTSTGLNRFMAMGMVSDMADWAQGFEEDDDV
jgi:hypothetical protein